MVSLKQSNNSKAGKPMQNRYIPGINVLGDTNQYPVEE